MQRWQDNTIMSKRMPRPPQKIRIGTDNDVIMHGPRVALFFFYRWLPHKARINSVVYLYRDVWLLSRQFSVQILTVSPAGTG